MYIDLNHFAFFFPFVFLSREHTTRSQDGLLMGQKDCVTIRIRYIFSIIIIFLTVSH